MLTGVERGAHRAALAGRLSVEGFMPLDMRDELGRIPADVAQALRPNSEKGPRPAMRANIAFASGVLLVVPEALNPANLAPIGAVLQAIRSARIPSLICDATTNLDEIAHWTRPLAEGSGSTHVVVTGPRATRWQQGENVARRIVAVMATTAGDP